MRYFETSHTKSITKNKFMIHPLIKKSSFAETITLLNSGTNAIKPQKILWYPACGNDFRVLHHPVTNNLSIDADFYILNDSNNYEEEVMTQVDNNPNFDCTSYRIKFPDLPPTAICCYKKIAFDNGYVRARKNVLFLWGISFEQLLEIFIQKKSKIETIFIKRFNDPRINEEISNTMNVLNTKYYINSFYKIGFPIKDYYADRLTFARNHNLRLCQYSSYQNFGQENMDSMENVFVFERAN